MASNEAAAPPASSSIASASSDVGIASTAATEVSSVVFKRLRARWEDLTAFVLSAGVKEKWWHMICEHYASRPFHNLERLEAQLELFDTYKDRLRDRYAVAFTIFFKQYVSTNC